MRWTIKLSNSKNSRLCRLRKDYYNSSPRLNGRSSTTRSMYLLPESRMCRSPRKTNLQIGLHFYEAAHFRFLTANVQNKPFFQFEKSILTENFQLIGTVLSLPWNFHRYLSRVQGLFKQNHPLLFHSRKWFKRFFHVEERFEKRHSIKWFKMHFYVEVCITNLLKCCSTVSKLIQSLKCNVKNITCCLPITKWIHKDFWSI